jgi:hypothetical protein
MDVVAWGNVFRGETDDLPVTPDFATLRHLPHRHFVSGRDHL